MPGAADDLASRALGPPGRPAGGRLPAGGGGRRPGPRVLGVDDVTNRLREAAVLWVLDGEYARVVDAAVACLVADTGGDDVANLAGSAASDPYAERLAMVAAALDELGLPAVPDDPTRLAAEGAAILVRSRARGDLTAADLGSWLTGSLTCEVRERMEDALGE